MLPIDPRDGQGSFLPRHQFSRLGGACPPFLPSRLSFLPARLPAGEGPERQAHPGVGPAINPAPSLRDIVPAQAMAHGGTIIRPGAVAWGGLRDPGDSGYASGESIERVLAAAVADPGQLPALLAELAGTKLWVPLPVRRRPFTDGTAVRLPLVGYAETDADFVPCFTSVQRLTAWSDQAEPDPRSGEPGAGADEFRGGGGRQWQRAGDTRVVPHVVVPAAGLARRLPAGLGLALNPDGAPGLPLFPEAVSYLARLAEPASATIVIAHPPAEPQALLSEVRTRLRPLAFAGSARRAWLAVPGRGEGLVIAVDLDDPASAGQRQAAVGALVAAVAAVPLRVPFPVDATFPGEPGDAAAPAAPGGGHGLLADWLADNTRPFYTRD